MDTWETVQRLIKEKKVKKVDLATELKISRQTLDNWIKGDTAPDQKDIGKMSKILESFPEEIRGSKILGKCLSTMLWPSEDTHC